MHHKGGNNLKAFYIPASLLVLLLLISLWGSAYIQDRTEKWITIIEDLSPIAEEDRWYEVESKLLALHKDWMDSQKIFHLILAHDDLDSAEKYFSGALAACREEDRVELRIHLSQLVSQFVFLGDTQKVQLKHIL